MNVHIKMPMLLQIVTIASMSVAASFAFQRTITTFQINGQCFYRYVVIVAAIFSGYVCFSKIKKSVAVAFSFGVAAIALSPFSQEAITMFPFAVPILATLMGVSAVLIVPASRGKGFFEFTAVLVLPAILAESRVGGSLRLLATIEQVSYVELSAITVIIVGGYFYLRYAAAANLRRNRLLSGGANQKDVALASGRSNNIIFLIVACASAIAAFLMVATQLFSEVLRGTIAAMPLYVIFLAMGAGAATTTIFYVFQRSRKSRSGLASSRTSV